LLLSIAGVLRRVGGDAAAGDFGLVLPARWRPDKGAPRRPIKNAAAAPARASSQNQKPAKQWRRPDTRRVHRQERPKTTQNNPINNADDDRRSSRQQEDSPASPTTTSQQKALPTPLVKFSMGFSAAYSDPSASSSFTGEFLLPQQPVCCAATSIKQLTIKPAYTYASAESILFICCTGRILLAAFA
jgi:hypothetical protein